jgi:HSP20 family protein
MLMRTDQFRELDRLAQQVFGTMARPTVMPMDAWRDGEHFVVEFDLPGVDPSSIDLDVERNVLTVKAERNELPESTESIAAERPRGVFSRQLFLGETLDTDRSGGGGGQAAKDPDRGGGPRAPGDLGLTGLRPSAA